MGWLLGRANSLVVVGPDLRLGIVSGVCNTRAVVKVP